MGLPFMVSNIFTKSPFCNGNDFLHVFIFCAETVGGCPAVAEAKQAVRTDTEPTQDATHVIGRLGIGQRDVTKGGTPVSTGIHSN